MIRVLTIRNTDAMAYIHQQGFDRPWKSEAFSTMLQSTKVKCFGFFKNKLISFIALQIVSDEAEILTIATDPTYKRLGYASQLLKYSLQYLINNQVKFLFLEVNANNKIAIRMYDKFDFKPFGKRLNYYKTNHGFADAIVLRLDL